MASIQNPYMKTKLLVYYEINNTENGTKCILQKQEKKKEELVKVFTV